MSAVAAKTRSRRSWIKWCVALVVAAILGSICWVGVEITDAAAEQQVFPADAIVVFGAAQYSGRPSPVYRARLDHAFDLYQRRVAATVITSGGSAGDPRYSEGGVGHDYLMRRGIPESSLIAETQGSDTAQSAARVAVIMRANHMRSCIAVSDAYHVFRVRKLLEHEGLQVYIAPRPNSRPHSVWQRTATVLRESVSFLLWRLHLIDWETS